MNTYIIICGTIIICLCIFCLTSLLTDIIRYCYDFKESKARREYDLLMKHTKKK